MLVLRQKIFLLTAFWANAHQMFSSNEFISGERSQPVAVQIDGGRVHRDELRDVRVVPLTAVDDVSGPKGRRDSEI